MIGYMLECALALSTRCDCRMRSVPESAYTPDAASVVPSSWSLAISLSESSVQCPRQLLLVHRPVNDGRVAKIVIDEILPSQRQIVVTECSDADLPLTRWSYQVIVVLKRDME